MEKKNSGNSKNPENLGLRNKSKKEVLEPSSTGYGLETALTDTEGKQNRKS